MPGFAQFAAHFLLVQEGGGVAVAVAASSGGVLLMLTVGQSFCFVVVSEAFLFPHGPM